MTNSNHTKNSDGESAAAKPQSSIEKSIQTSVAVRTPRDQVALIAYQIYLQEGRPQGRDLQHWLEAEAQLAAVPPVTIKTEMTVKTEITVKSEVGATAKTDKPVAKLAV
jgi:hypothetical protein